MEIEREGGGLLYRPLVDHPELFLEFARLKLETPGVSSFLPGHPPTDHGDIFDEYDYGRLDTDRNAEVVGAWVHNNGVLGIGPPGFMGYAGPNGGPNETVWRFVVEWWIANRTLRLYEAATAREVDVDTVQKIAPSLVILEDEPYVAQDESPESNRRHALDVVGRYVESKVNLTGCYPALRRQGDGLVQGWHFDSLLGAMWLQMMFLVADDSDRRCRRPGCNGTIPEGARKDRIYCGDSCKTLASRARNAGA